MINLLSAVLAASTVKSIGAVIAVITGIGFVWYAAANIRSGRHEVASEIELAPNRKPFYDDEALEGPRLTRMLSLGLVLLAVVSVGLPLYWLNEPSRQQGAIENFDQTFVSRGARLFSPTAEGGYNCAGCHGDKGVGGSAPFTLTDSDAKFVASVAWQSPALDTVLLRYSQAELKDILTYGRPGTPMPAWGLDGGGPLTDQQLDELIAYIDSIQITSDAAKAQVEAEIRKEMGLAEGASIDYTDPAVGKVIFNLGLKSGAAGGAYSCARCHTKGASIVPGSQDPATADLTDHVGFPDGSGAFGFSLDSQAIPRQFLSIKDLVSFLHRGSEFGVLYGQRGQGSGRMPGFGDNPDDKSDLNDDADGDGMFTEDMIRAVGCYEASLGGTPIPGCVELARASETPDSTTTTTKEP